MCRGFTVMSPEELPNCQPSRSLSDNMESQRTITGKMRTVNFSNDGGDESKVKAYTEVQFGRKALESDAYDEGLPEKVGDFKDDGLSVFDNHAPPEMYKSANGLSDEEEDGDEDDE